MNERLMVGFPPPADHLVVGSVRLSVENGGERRDCLSVAGRLQQDLAVELQEVGRERLR